MLLQAVRTMDEQLQDLINEVRQYQEASSDEQKKKLQKALDRLLKVIQRLPGISTQGSTHPNYPEALNRTWYWVSRNIHKFDPEVPNLKNQLVGWINGYLRWRIKDLYIADSRYLFSLDQPLRHDGEEGVTWMDQLPDPNYPLNLTSLDLQIIKWQAEERQQIVLQLRAYIERDPEGLLRKCHPRRYPACHCQVLAQRLLLKDPPDYLTTVAGDFDIKYQTLNSHWKLKCLPLLQSICRNFGYESWSA